MKVEDLCSNYNEPHEFCIFSRVTKEKGIGDAILAIEGINRKFKREICYLDIYGPIAPDYENEFQGLLCSSTKCIRYMGEIDSDKSVDIIKNYY